METPSMRQAAVKVHPIYIHLLVDGQLEVGPSVLWLQLGLSHKEGRAQRLAAVGSRLGNDQFYGGQPR